MIKISIELKKEDVVNIKLNDSVVITEIEMLDVSKLLKSFDDYSWEEIKELVKTGNHNFKVGDIKKVTFDNKKHKIVIIGVDHDRKNTITCQFRDILFDKKMNNSYTNKGGFVVSDLHKYLNNEFINKLKSILGNVELEDKVFETKPTKIFLPSEFEVFGRNDYSEKESFDKQYDYFKDRRNRLKFDCDEDNTYWWWLRSTVSSSASDFVLVCSSGSVSGNLAYGSYGVSPCFII